MQQRIVPGVAVGVAAFAIRALGIAFLQLGKNPLRLPAQTQRQMAGVHAEIIEDATFAAGGIETLPVRGFRGIEIAAVMETGHHLQNTANGSLACDFKSPLCAGEERHLRAATHEATTGFRGLHDAPCGV